MLVWRGPRSMAPFWYTTRFTPECIPSRRGPRTHPEPNSSPAFLNPIMLLLLLFSLLCSLRLQWILDRILGLFGEWGVLRRETSDMEKGNNPMWTIIAFLFLLLDGKPDSRLILFFYLFVSDSSQIQYAFFAESSHIVMRGGSFVTIHIKSFKYIENLWLKY